MTLTDFLLARIAEDEATAINWTRFEVRDGIPGSYAIKDRVLAECETKGRLLDLFDAQDEFGNPADARFARALLALPYADHPDYRDEWKP